jgi:NADH:ubiquinone reductase (H+-translocating)
MDNNSVRKVVILGGGYAGVMSANRLAGTLGNKVHVTLVNPIAQFVERLLLHEVAARADSDSATRHTVAGLLNPAVRVLVGSATEIRPVERKIVGVDSRSGLPWTLGYDELIYAIGSGAVLDPVPGVQEFAHDLSSLEQGHRLRAALTALPAGKTVLVVGGGTTAIEMVTELAVARPHLALKIITSSLLAPTVSPTARDYVRNAQAMRRVDIIEDTPITEVTRHGVVTADGRTVAADCIVWAASFAVPDLAKNSGLAVDKSGRLLVDGAMRSTVHPNILGAGDGAVVTGPAGKTLRMACATAAPQGAHAAATIIADSKGRTTKPFALSYLVLSMSLGPGDGLIQPTNSDDSPRGFTLNGKPGALFNELNNRYARSILSWERRKAGTYRWAKPRKRQLKNSAA